jgi:hypothetical protein
MTCHSFIAFLALMMSVSAVSLGQKPEAMSPQFKEQASKAFRLVEHIDPDARVLQSQAAHRAVNGLFDKIKTPTDKYVHDILFTWLAEIEMGRRDIRIHPASARQWMKAQVECQTEATFYFDFDGLTEDGQKKAVQDIAQKTCITAAKEFPLMR